MILCDTDLSLLMRDGLIADPDFSLINPASVDIRIGKTMLKETSRNVFVHMEIPAKGVMLEPGAFVCIATHESFNVPNGYAMDLRLKSSRARAGWDHSLAFWVDPGWQGVLTMEIKNVLAKSPLFLIPGERFAQIIVHKLSGLSARPYDGKYKGATSVQGDKT